MLNIYSKESLENDYQHLCFSLKKETKICRSRFKVFFFLKYTNQTSYLKKDFNWDSVVCALLWKEVFVAVLSIYKFRTFLL